MKMQTQFRQAILWGCLGWISTCPNYGVHSNSEPLAFGMSPEAAAAALETPLTPLATGRSGSAIYYAEGTSLASGFIVRERERLWMQFRRGRLSGWKYDWDRPMAW